jgi:hypothetical protein
MEDVEGELGLLPTGSNSDGMILRWLAMASKVAGGKAERERLRGSEMGEKELYSTTREAIRPQPTWGGGHWQ